MSVNVNRRSSIFMDKIQKKILSAPVGMMRDNQFGQPKEEVKMIREEEHDSSEGIITQKSTGNIDQILIAELAQRVILPTFNTNQSVMETK